MAFAKNIDNITNLQLKNRNKHNLIDCSYNLAKSLELSNTKPSPDPLRSGNHIFNYSQYRNSFGPSLINFDHVY